MRLKLYLKKHNKSYLSWFNINKRYTNFLMMSSDKNQMVMFKAETPKVEKTINKFADDTESEPTEKFLYTFAEVIDKGKIIILVRKKGFGKIIGWFFPNIHYIENTLDILNYKKFMMSWLNEVEVYR